jgi:hypothetical protein
MGFAAIAGIVLLGSVAFVSTAEAAKLSKAELAAYKQANVACKAEAKGKKVGGFLARRKYVKNCIVEQLKGHPNIDVDKIIKAMDTGGLPQTQVESHM